MGVVTLIHNTLHVCQSTLWSVLVILDFDSFGVPVYFVVSTCDFRL